MADEAKPTEKLSYGDAPREEHDKEVLNDSCSDDETHEAEDTDDANDDTNDARKLSATLEKLSDAYTDLMSEHKRALSRFQRHMKDIQPLLASAEDHKLAFLKQGAHRKRRSKSIGTVDDDKDKDRSYMPELGHHRKRRSTWNPPGDIKENTREVLERLQLQELGEQSGLKSPFQRSGGTSVKVHPANGGVEANGPRRRSVNIHNLKFEVGDDGYTMILGEQDMSVGTESVLAETNKVDSEKTKIEVAAQEGEGSMRESAHESSTSAKNSNFDLDLIKQTETPPSFFARLTLPYLRCFPVLKPDSAFRSKWNLVIIFMLMWYSVSIPFSISFSVTPSGWWRACEIVFDIIFGVDIIMNFSTAYQTETAAGVQILIMNRKLIGEKYLKGWFIIDVLSLIPFDLIVQQIVGTGASIVGLSRLLRMLKLFRLLRIMGMGRYLHYWTERLNPGILRLLQMMVTICLTLHMLGCVFFYISDLDPDNLETWADIYGVRNSTQVSVQYVASLYWSFTTMTSVGYGDIVPQNQTERIYVIFAMGVSSAMFGYFVGNMAHIISSVDSTQTLFKERMEFVREYMAHQELPEELQIRIKSYYFHSWKSLPSFPFSEKAILDDLSPALRREIVMRLNKEMVEKVPLFTGQPESFICQVILAMTSEVCAPLDFVIRKDEAGRCMFFVRKGLLEVCNADGSEVYTTLSDGAYFGEVSLLVGGRRTASVRAIFHCSLMRLEQDDLDDILADFPEALGKIVELAAGSKYQLNEEDRRKLQNRLKESQRRRGEDFFLENEAKDRQNDSDDNLDDAFDSFDEALSESKDESGDSINELHTISRGVRRGSTAGSRPLLGSGLARAASHGKKAERQATKRLNI